MNRPSKLNGLDKVMYNLLYILISDLVYFGLINFQFGTFISRNNYIIRMNRVQILSSSGLIYSALD
jgi:hypothetical protein